METEAIPEPSGGLRRNKSKGTSEKRPGSTHKARTFPVNAGAEITQGRQAYVGACGPGKAGFL